MELYAKKTLEEFSQMLASGSPTPGGGGASAYVCSLGAALGCMVCALSAGKKSCAEFEDDIKTAGGTLEAIRKHCLRMVDEDSRAFAPLQKCWTMPKDDPERGTKLDAALRVACQVPTDVMYAACDALTALASLAEKGAGSAISDVGVAVELCRAALLGSQHTIEINASLIPDEVFAMTLRRENQLVREQFLPVADAALAKVRERIG